MTPITSRSKNVKPRNVALAGLLAAAMSLSGCGRGDENSQAIRQAKTDLETLAATHQPGESGGKTSYDKVISGLAKAAESSRPGEAAAARLLRSRAYLRQGDEAADVVTMQEREARERAAAIRSYHDQWLDLNAQAEALKKFDASKALQQIDSDIRAKETEIDKAKAALAQAEQELKSLQDRAAAAQEKSRSQRDQEMDFRNQMISKSQTERAELVRQANESKRRGDGFDMEAADLMAQAGRQRPLIAELQMRLQRLEAQKTMQGAAKGELAAAAQQATKQADRALKGTKDGDQAYVGAQQVADELAKAVDSLNELRAATTAPAEDAGKLYAQALSEVQRAKGGGGAGGARGGTGVDTKLAEASVHHAEADLLLIRARGLESQASLLKLLAETKPGLPKSAEYAKEADKTAEEAKTVLSEAQVAFGTARDLYEGAGATQKAQSVKERLEQIAKSLAAFDTRKPTEATEPEVAQTPPGEKPAAEPTTPSIAEKPTEAPTPEVSFEGDKAEVFALLQKIQTTAKAKNYEAIIPMIVFRNAQQEEMFKKTIPVVAKEEALSEACVERFGRDLFDLTEEWLSQLGIDTSTMERARGAGQRAFRRLRTMDPADVEINVLPDGTDAEVSFKSARTADPIECMKIDGAWRAKLDYDLERQVNSDSFLQAEAKVYETVADNVKSGKYGNDSKKMIQDLYTELFKQFTEMLKPRDENK